MAYATSNMMDARRDAYFDPFEILNVDSYADEKSIKSSYRRLSKLHHPDRPTGDAREFMRISKAYKALTSKEGRENYQKYGHPDGPQSLTMKMAIPSIVQDNGNAFVTLYLVGLCVGLPMLLVLAKRCVLGEDAVVAKHSALCRSFAQHFSRYLRSSPRKSPDSKDMLEIFTSVISEVIFSKPLQKETSLEVQNKIAKLSPKQTDENVHAVSTMLTLHLSSLVDSKKFKSYETNEILGVLYDSIVLNMAPAVRAMIEVSLRSKSFSIANKAVELASFLHQGVSLYPGEKNTKDQVLKLQKKACEAENRSLPATLKDLRVQAYTDGEETVCCNDIVTVTVKAKLPKSKKERHVRSLLRFNTLEDARPMVEKERFIVLVGDDDDLVCSGLMRDDKNVMSCKMQCRAPRSPRKDWSLRVVVKSTTYVVPDVVHTEVVDVIPLEDDEGDDNAKEEETTKKER